MLESNFRVKSQAYRFIIEHVPASIVITDSDGKIEYVNQTFLDVTGYSTFEVLGKTQRIIKSGLQSMSFYQDLWTTIKSGNIWSGELQNRKKDASLFWEKVTISPIYNDDGVITHFIAVKQDITQKKEEEQKALQRQRFQEELSHLNKTGGWEYDLDNRKLTMTNELYDILGLSAIQKDNKWLLSIAIDRFEESELLWSSFFKLFEEGREFDLTLWLKKRNGKRKCVRIRSKAVYSGNMLYKIYGSVKDITEEVEKERALHRSEQKLWGVANSFEDVIFTLDENGAIVDLFSSTVNPEKRSELKGKTAAEILGADGEEHRKNFLKAYKGTHTTYSFKVSDNNEICHYQVKLSPFPEGVLGVARNITKEVAIQDELRKTKEHLDYALTATQAGSWDWHIETGETEISSRCAELLGFELPELIPFNFDKWVYSQHPVDLPVTLEELYKHLDGNTELFDIKSRMQKKNGGYAWMWTRGQVVQWNDKNEPLRMVGTIVDINEWKNAEEALKLSEKRYKDLFTKSSDPILLLKDNKIINCNDALIKRLGYNNKKEVAGQSPIQISHEVQEKHNKSKDWYEMLNRFTGHNSYSFEWNLRHVNGTAIPFEITITPILDENGQEMIYVVLRDISERKRNQKLVLESLKEKETLLAEIHHRVKNNLAVISGIMQLQLLNSENEHDAEVLNKSINRIKSIAIVHEQLYKSDNFSNILLSDNIRMLAQSVHELSVNSNSASVILNLELDEVMININQAFTIGLLFNEILTNAYKYAFKGLEKGKIYISLKEKNNEICLIVADNGIGIDKDVDRNATQTLGHTLIDTFFKQLDAKVKVESSKGTKYIIKFKKMEKKGVVAHNLNLPM